MKLNQKLELEDHVFCITICYFHVPTYLPKHNLHLRTTARLCPRELSNQIKSINITFIKIYTPCSLSTELRAIKYITVINLSISKIIKYIADIKTIKLLNEKIRQHLKNWKYTNSKKMTNNKREIYFIKRVDKGRMATVKDLES